LPGELGKSRARYVRELCDYWRNSYDWRFHEAALNAYPQFISTIDNVDIHYWHVRGNSASPVPLPWSTAGPVDLRVPPSDPRLTDPVGHGDSEAAALMW
jgi:hypothetical protein